MFHIQRFSPHDGPGIRTTVFLKGCPLRCSWCHNPEGVQDFPELVLRGLRCVECGACEHACPEHAAVPARAGGSPVAACTRCGRCVEACPTGARERVGEPLAPEAVVEEVIRDRVFFEESGGGVTFSGGEPLAQPRFLLECLDACRRHGLHVAVDTCGHAAPEVVLETARRADLVLFDVKVLDSARHRGLTGVDNRLILANLEMLARRDTPLWLRVPVLPGLNDDDANLEATARLAVSLGSVRRVCLLPYHRAGTAKQSAERVAGPGGNLHPPEPDRLREIARRFEAYGLAVSVGG